MLAIAAAIGLLIGLVMGSLGGGGAVLLVPVLVFVFHLSAHDASTTALLIVGAGAVAGVLAHARRGHVRWRNGLIFGALGTPGAWAGSQLSALLDPDLLLLAFAGLLVVVAALMLRSARDDEPADTEPETRRVTLVLSALGVGLLTGFFGVGGGFAVVPALVLLLRFAMPIATGTSLLVVLINSLVALATRATGGLDLDWPLVAVFSIAAVVGNLAGGALASHVRAPALQRGFAVLLLLVAAYVGVRSGLALSR